METSSPEGVSILDKDESSEKAYHVVDGFVIEDSKSPFPVSAPKHHKKDSSFD
jgi:chaperonin GroEL (HSP60 family)